MIVCTRTHTHTNTCMTGGRKSVNNSCYFLPVFLPLEQGALLHLTQKKTMVPVVPEVFEHGMWQWKGDDGKWINYSPELNATIEKSFKRKNDGSCVITRDGIK